MAFHRPIRHPAELENDGSGFKKFLNEPVQNFDWYEARGGITLWWWVDVDLSLTDTKSLGSVKLDASTRVSAEEDTLSRP